MSQPIHTPGPCTRGVSEHEPDKIYIYGNAGPNGPRIATVEFGLNYGQDIATETAGNARLLAAAYNAFDSAAKKLGLNAVELGESMADGGIAELIQAVRAAKELSDWFMEHSRQADHAHSELKQPLHETSGWKELIDSGYNGLMASYDGQFEEALAKVKEGAS